MHYKGARNEADRGRNNLKGEISSIYVEALG